MPELPILDLVDGFDREWWFLSNFAFSPLLWEGVWYATAEAAFAAGKTVDPALRLWISQVVPPREAKRRGRQLALRPQWDTSHRYAVMRQVLRAKFTDPGLRTRLINTGAALLVESNTWCDTQWGSCVCQRHRATPGHNHLGRMLMALRDALTAVP
ncbi:hypothetical protein KUTG_10011, partial [Kutzneria sp. 744]